MTARATRAAIRLGRAALFALVAAGCAVAPPATRLPENALGEDPAIGAPLRVLWIKDLYRPTYAAEFQPTQFAEPAVDATRVYVGTSRGKMYALDARNGRVHWRFDAYGPIESRPRIHGDSLIFGDSDGVLYAVDTKTGLVRWTFQAAGEVMGVPEIGEGRVYFATAANRVYALSLDDGAWSWTHQRELPATFSVRGVASPVLAGGTLFTAYSDGYIVALNPKNGKEIWKQLLNIEERLADVDTTPVIDGESMYVGAYDGALYCLDLEYGNVRWKREGAGGVSAPALAGGALFTATANGELVAVDAAAGDVLWRVNLKDQDARRSIAKGPRLRLKVGSKPVILGRHVYTATSQGRLFAVDAYTGQVRWRTHPGSGVTSAPGVHGGRLYFLANGGSVWAMEPVRDLARR
ncbi:PQQ-binding-like beta-propeller repeat protein [bacterium]|nr:PQQ-binding-like beta-propeller repeat protein [bacterium]